MPIPTQLEDTQLYALLVARVASREDRRFLANVESVFSECLLIANTVGRVLPEYTLHDEVHLFGVLDRIARLIPQAVVERLCVLELGALILSVGAHDIGMSPPVEYIERLRRAHESISPDQEQLAFLRYQERHADLGARARTLRLKGKQVDASEIDGFLLAGFIRDTHAERGSVMIHSLFAARLEYGGQSFVFQLAKVCASHAQDIAAVEQLPVCELVRAPGEYCNWRFVALLLRLADILDFDAERTPSTLFRHLGVRDTISVREWKKHLAVNAWDIRPGTIAFSASCADPVIEETIRGFIRDIDTELRNGRLILRGMHCAARHNVADLYDIQLASEVDSSAVKPQFSSDGPLYTYVDVRFRLDHDSIAQLLMGLALYGQRSLFLRELIQNAVDSCRFRRALGEAGYSPAVKVAIRRENGSTWLSVEDNGMGMTQRIVENYFARVGKSYYRSTDFRDRASTSDSFRPVSQFGIGVLSAFMAGDTLAVETRSADEGEPLSVEIADQGALFWFRRGIRSEPGTLVSVRLTHPIEELLPTQLHPPRGFSTDSIPGDLSRLIGTVAALAPHVDVPLWCCASGAEACPLSSFVSPPSYLDAHVQLQRIDIDLSSAGVKGIEGQMVVLLPRDPSGKLADTIEVRGTVRGPDGKPAIAPEAELAEWYEITFGGLFHREYKRAIDGEGYDGSGRLSLSATGRLSQQGFVVPFNLFSFEGGQPWVILPLPVTYDINLSAPFILPLTADRTRVAPTTEGLFVASELGVALTGLMVDALKSEITDDPAWFTRLAIVGQANAHAFSAALRRVMRPTEFTGQLIIDR